MTKEERQEKRKSCVKHGKAIFYINNYLDGVMCFTEDRLKKHLKERLLEKGYSVHDIVVHYGEDRNKFPYYYVQVFFTEKFWVFSKDKGLAGRGPFFEGFMKAKMEYEEAHGIDY